MRSFLATHLTLVLLLGGCGGEEEAFHHELAIVNGVDDPGHPAVGLLEAPNGLCTGTLVGGRTVLSAAHCVDQGGTYRFRIGGQSFKAAKVISHPEYQKNVKVPGLEPAWFSVGDIAVILLEDQVEGIAPMGFSAKEPSVGQSITLVGYGVTKPKDTTPEKKRRTENVIGNLGPGYILYGTWGGLKGSSGQTCFGDSGGPTIVTEDGEERILAVTSLGDPDCALWTFSARTDFYLDWIRQTAEGNLGVPGDRTPPTVVIDSPLGDKPLPPSFSVKITSQDDGAGIASLALLVDGKEVGKSDQPTPSLAVTGLAPGPHELKVVATDRAGNASEARLSVQVADEKRDDPVAAEATAPSDPTLAGGCSLEPGRAQGGGGLAPLLLLALVLLWRRRAR